MTQEDIVRYHKAAHAMQTGVKMMQNYEHPEMEIKGNIFEASDSPKHLRVGINSALSNAGGLVKLLIDKGIITADEYHKAIADAMEEEVKEYEKRINDEIMPGKDGKFKLI